MKSLITFLFLLLAFQLISASQFYPRNSSPKEEFPENSEPKENYPENYTEQKEKYPQNYTKQKEKQPENYSEQKEVQPGNYSEHKEQQPENYSKQKEDRHGNYSEEREQPENYSEQEEDQPGNYFEQNEEHPKNYSEQIEDKPENYSEQKEVQPGNYSEHKEQQPENYSEQKEDHHENYSEEREQPENNSEQKEDHPEKYSEQKEEHHGNYSEQIEDKPGNYSEQKEVQPGNYSEPKDQQPENYSEHKEDQPENYFEQKEEHPENYSEQNEDQTGNYSEQRDEQPEKHSEQKEDQPGNYSEERKEHPRNYSKQKEDQPENYSEQKEDQTGNYSEERDEQHEKYPEQKEEQPKNYSEQNEEENDGNNNDEKDGPSLTIPTLLDSEDDLLSFVHYHHNCPQAESIINRKVKEWFKKDYTLAASLLRLHFHDCAVRGCDGSILLDHEGSERRAEESKSLRGFEVIDDIKAEIEKVCPKTVSCADILTAASRDATVLLGGPYWMVPYGRKDGIVSVDNEAQLVPMGLENITSLIEFYQSNGLNVLDLVVLSGAHTIGRATCGSIQHRLYNFEGTGKPDPSLDTQYLNFLTRKCRWASEYVDLDGTTPNKFDNEYYKNLQKNMGILSSDQLLFSDLRTAPLVNALASDPQVFYHQFGVSMAKLGNIIVPSVLDDGEIRNVCSSVNFDHY